MTKPTFDATEGGRSNQSWPSDAAKDADDVLVVDHTDRFRGAAAQLRADLRKSRPFDNGTIIRWDSVAGSGARFNHAAIFADGNWYTTIQEDNRHLKRRMTHEELLGYFNNHGYSIANVAVAVDFDPVQL